MKKTIKFSHFLICLMCAIVAVLSSSCATCLKKSTNPNHSGSAEERPTGLIHSVDHSPKTWETNYRNAYLWKRVKDKPAVFHPKCLPQGFSITQKSGDWVVDPQDQAAFFVPYTECGGYSPEMWRAEANKAVNRFSKKEKTSRNMATVMIVWPLYKSGLENAVKR